MKKFWLFALSASLVLPTAVLAQSGGLTAGKPAGVAAAQMDRTTVLVGVGAVAILVGVAVAASDCCQSSRTPVPLTVAPTTTV
jgi:hypothetical protein